MLGRRNNFIEVDSAFAYLFEQFLITYYVSAWFSQLLVELFVCKHRNSDGLASASR